MDVRDREPDPPGRPSGRVPLTTTSLALLCGVGLWLLLTPWTLEQPSADAAARWMDPVIGALVLSVAIGRLAFPDALRWTGPIHASLGGALLLAPSVLGYDDGGVPDSLLASDLLCGVVIAGLALLTLPSVEAGLRTKRRTTAPPR